MNQIYLNYFINKILFIIVTFIILCCQGEDACSACSQPPPTVLQPKDSGAKCINAPILESFTVAAQVDTNTCKYYVKCNKTASIVAHLADKNESSCLTGLHYMYFFCINSTWMAEFRGNYYPGVDQLYCYESDENSCSKCPNPIQPLQPGEPGGESKCDSSNDRTITASTLKNVTDDSSVCMWQVLCSDSSSGTSPRTTDASSDYCTHLYQNNLSPVYMCFNGTWTSLYCDDGDGCISGSYHEIDAIYCYGPMPVTVLITKGTTKTIYEIVIPSVIALLVVISAIIVCIYYRRKRQAPEVLRSEAQENHYVQTMR